MLRRLSVVSCYCAKKVIRSNTTLSKCVLKVNPSKQIISTYSVSRSFTDHAHDHAHKDEPFLDPKQVTERIVEVIKNFEKVNKEKISANARFKEDLDLDSLDSVEVVMAIEEEFNIEIPDSEADKILSVKDAVAYVSAHPMAK